MKERKQETHKGMIDQMEEDYSQVTIKKHDSNHRSNYLNIDYSKTGLI